MEPIHVRARRARRNAFFIVLLSGATILAPIAAKAWQTCQGCIGLYQPPAPPSTNCGADCIPAGHPKIQITGAVLNPRGVPVSGAQVYWPYGSVTTNSSGSYAINVCTDGCTNTDGTQKVTLTASVSWGWGSITLSNPSTQGLVAQNITATYFISIAVSPRSFQATTQQTITFSLYSMAPVAGTKAIVEFLPTGTTQQLNFDTSYVDPSGWSRWTGTMVIPAGTAEGRYNYEACALDALASGNCDAPGGTILSQVASDYYAVDRTPPQVLSATPGRFSDVTTAPTISATWGDSLSGVDPSSLRMSIDGNAVNTTVNGATISTNGSSPAPGVHVVDAQAADLAGNVTTSTWLFTVVTLSGSSANASLLSRSVAVNPSGSTPQPTTVTFTSPQVAVPRTTITLNASTGSGYGLVHRGVALGSAAVQFSNGSGATQTVSLNIPPSSYDKTLGTLAPSAGALTATFPASQFSIPDLVVSVPAGFGDVNSSATLIGQSVPLGSVTVDGLTALQTKWSGPVPVLGTMGVCAASTLNASCVADNSNPQVFAQLPDGTPIREIAVPVNNGASDHSAFADVQSCTGSPGCSPSENLAFATARASFECPTTSIAGRSLNLCTASGLGDVSLWSGTLNGWIYQEGGRFPVWQQNHLDAGSTPCTNGVPATLSTSNYRLFTNTISNDGSTNALIGGTDPAGDYADPLYVYLGTQTGVNRPVPSNTGSTFQLTNKHSGGPDPAIGLVGSGTYTLPTIQGTTLPDRTFQSSPSATTNGWDLSPAALSNGVGVSSSIGLITGTEFTTPKTSGQYDLLMTVSFQFVYNATSC